MCFVGDTRNVTEHPNLENLSRWIQAQCSQTIGNQAVQPLNLAVIRTGYSSIHFFWKLLEGVSYETLVLDTNMLTSGDFSAPQESRLSIPPSPTRVSHQSVWQESPTRMPYKSVPQ